MSLLGDIFGGIVDIGSKAIDFVKGSSIASTLLKTVITGYTLNKTTNSIKKQNATNTTGGGTIATVDPGVRLQVPADQSNKVPVVYGQAQLGGIITEAVMDQDNTRMTYVMTICEMTGTKLSDSAASSFTFKDVYYNDQRIVFETTGGEAGITAAYSTDSSGNRDYSIAGLVKVYCYNGNSDSGVAPENYTNGSVPAAYSVVPNWTSAHDMNDLIFAVVQVTYSRDKGVTGLPNMRFHIANSMTLPGDCLLDYMTSTRYGAGIPVAEIYDE